jgi:hypothetical protein
MSSWRAGELVRQVIVMHNRELSGRHGLWVDAGQGRVEVGEVDTEQFHLSPSTWYRRRMSEALRTDDWDGVDALMLLGRHRGVEPQRVRQWVLDRIEVLLDRGLLDPAGRQIQMIHPSSSRESMDERLAHLSRRLAAAAIRSAKGHIRRSRWSLALSRLETAARADPRSPLIALRRDQMRSMHPATSALMPTLELELAMRALVLHPSSEGLSRVMRAQLAMERAHHAALAYHVWKERVTPDERCRYLLAKALARTGQLKRALMITEQVLEQGSTQVLEQGPTRPLSRRCPPWHPLQPLALRAQLNQILKLPPAAQPPYLAPEGDRIKLGRHSELLSHCARWEPGAPVEVELDLWLPTGEDLPLVLIYGSRRRRLEVPGARSVLRRISMRMHLPPASYPMQLQTGEGRRVDLGTVNVGAEANFGFELGSYSSWQRQGQAFGATPAAGRGDRWRAVHGFVGDYYADSRGTGSGESTGTLTSPAFQLQRGHLMLLVAGGDDPALGIDLQIDGKPLFTVRGNRAPFFRSVFLPIARYRGQWARVGIRDGSRAARWGYLAVDEIRQLEGPAPKVAP